MKIVLQRVSSAVVKVDGKICGSIGTGYLVLLGIGNDDTEDDCRRLADKIINLRIFSDSVAVYSLCGLPQGKPS